MADPGLFFLLSIFVAIKAFEDRKLSNFALLGLCCGLAGLSRYTSYILAPSLLVCLLLAESDRNKMVALGCAYCAMFTLVSALWWIPNWIENGAPLHTWQYLNVGSRLLGDRFVWYWKTQEHYSSLSQIIANHSDVYISNFFRNLKYSQRHMVSSIPGGVYFLLLSIYYMWSKVSKSIVVGTTVTFGIFVAVVSQAFVFRDVFLSWTIVFSVWIAGMLASWCSGQVPFGDRFRRAAMKASAAAVLVMVATGGYSASEAIVKYVSNDHIDRGQLVNNPEIAEVLSQEENIARKYVMSVNPARAYYAGANWLSAPLYYEGSLQGLVDYEGIGPKVRNYAPKFPNSNEHFNYKVDYLIYDLGLKRHLPQFEFLLAEDPHSKIPNHFEILYWSPEAVVIKIDRSS